MIDTPLSRRTWLNQSAGLAGLATAWLLSEQPARPDTASVLAGMPHFKPTAKRVLYLFQSGAPSQLDLFDYKPALANLRGSELPDSIRQGQRLTGMTSKQTSFPVAPTRYRFARHGQSGAWFSELLPYTAEIADELSFIKSMHTEAINHDPAVTFFQDRNSTRLNSSH